jgi:VanZ family protein
MRNFIRFWSPVVLWMIVIFVFSSKTKVALTDSYTISFVIFKTIHIFEYAFLYLLWYRAFANTGIKKNQAFIYAFLLTICYAATDELHQRFVPTREGKVRDVIIDAAGGILGWIVLVKFLPKMRGRLKRLVKSWQLL